MSPRGRIPFYSDLEYNYHLVKQSKTLTMKRHIMLFLLWLGYSSSFAQVNTPNYTTDSQPITTSGISLPQLITTDLNRSELQFRMNLSEGLEHPHLSANYQKFISDKKKQFFINAGIRAVHSFSNSKNDDRDFYTLHNMSFNLGADLKLFNANNYFIEFGTKNRISKLGDLTNFNFLSTSNSVTLGLGKGRIDFVNDAAATITIIEQLSKYGVLNRELTENEYSLLTEKIRSLKNRRRFVNRSYPLTEVEEIQDLLYSLGVIVEGINVTAIINDAYRFEPMFNRTTGKQFKISASGSYSHSNFISELSNKGITASLSYMIHSPISTKWQYNKGIKAYAMTSKSSIDNPNFSDNRINRAGISINNEIHYLVDSRMRFGIISNIGYDFVDKLHSYDPFSHPYRDNEGFYLNARTQFEYQMTRTMSTTFGFNIEITPNYTFSELSLGLNF